MAGVEAEEREVVVVRIYSLFDTIALLLILYIAVDRSAVPGEVADIHVDPARLPQPPSTSRGRGVPRGTTAAQRAARKSGPMYV